MKSTFFKIAVIVLLEFVLIYFAGCDEKEAAETYPLVSESSEGGCNESETKISVKATEITESVTQQAAEAANVINGSESKTALVDLYNQSLEKSNLKRTSMSQKTEKGTINLGGQKIDLNESKNQELRSQTETSDNQKSACALKKLSYENIENAEKTDNKIIFTLKNCSVGTEISQGAGNYLGIVEKERTGEILNNAVKYLNLPGTVNVKSGEYTLHDGIITAYFSNDFTALEKVSFSGKEKVQGKVEYLIMQVKIDMEFTLNSVYET